MCVILKHAKFQPSSAKITFSNWELNKKRVENSTENWPYLGNDERYGQGYY